MKTFAITALLVLSQQVCFAAPNDPATKPAAQSRNAPEVLPGKGLAEHDFFYAGEQKERNMFIVRKGAIVWSYLDPNGKGEISDATLLSNGNVLFAHQFAVTLIDHDKKVLWNYDAPPQCEIHTAQAIGLQRVIFIVNGPQPKAMVVNVTTGQTEKEFPLAAKNPSSTHGQFRHARLTSAGTYLVAHMDAGKVSEYDENGKEVWTVKSPGVWGAVRLDSGNTLITTSKSVYEVDAKGVTSWQFNAADLTDFKVNSIQLASRLPSGNTLLNNWFNSWSSKPFDPNDAPLQAIEITPDRKIVWALRSWADPANLGPSTTIQILDDPAVVPENVHFGSIK